MKSLIILFLGMAIIPSLGMAQDALEYRDDLYSWNTTWMGGWAHGPCNDLAVQGDLTYFGDGSYLRIGDISNPESPLDMGILLLPGYIQGVAIEGDYAYVAADYAGLRIIDVSDPLVPVEVGYFETAGDTDGVFVKGHYVYVADSGDDGLHIIDVSNPLAPVEVGYLDTGNSVRDVHFSGNYAYVAASDAGLRIFDVSDPTAPVEVGYFDTPGSASDVFVIGNYAYVVDEVSFDYFILPSLRILDVSNPAEPVEASSFYYGPGGSGDLFVSGSYAYWSFGSQVDFFMIIDVSDPGAPVEVSISLGDSYRCLYVSGNYAFGGGNSGLHILNVSDPAAIVEVGSFDSDYRYANSVYVQGNYVYEGLNDGFLVLDVSNPMASVEVAFLNMGDSVSDVYVRNHLAYVSGVGLHIIDVSDPGKPVEVGSCDTEFYIRYLSVNGQYAYGAGWSGGFHIFDVNNPEAPVEVGFFETNLSTSIEGIFASGNFVYLAIGNAGLFIIDVSDPGAPIEVGHFDTGSFGVYVSGHYAYVISGGLYILDVTDAAAPVEVGLFDTDSNSKDVYVIGDFAYMTHYFDGLRIIDVSDPAAPVEVGYFDKAGTSDVFVTGNYAYVNSGGSLQIISNDLDCNGNGIHDQTDIANDPSIDFNNDGIIDSCQPGTSDAPGVEIGSMTILHDAFPNPFNPQTTIAFNLPAEMAISLGVFDIAGHLVGSLVDSEVLSAGHHDVRWTGRDNNGKKVASGIYFYRLEAGEFSETKRMVLIK